MKEPASLPGKAGSWLGSAIGFSFALAIFTLPFWEVVLQWWGS